MKRKGTASLVIWAIFTFSFYCFLVRLFPETEQLTFETAISLCRELFVRTSSPLMLGVFLLFPFIIGVASLLFSRFVLSKQTREKILTKTRDQSRLSAFIIFFGIIPAAVLIVIITLANQYKIINIPSPSLNPQYVECSHRGEMNLNEALIIARDNKECSEIGEITAEGHYCNTLTKKWWFKIVPEKGLANCDPACVVDLDSRTAELDLRCAQHDV